MGRQKEAAASAKSQLGAEQHEIIQHDVNAQTERPLQQNKLFNLAANRFASITVRRRIVRGGQRKTLPTSTPPPPSHHFLRGGKSHQYLGG